MCYVYEALVTSFNDILNDILWTVLAIVTLNGDGGGGNFLPMMVELTSSPK